MGGLDWAGTQIRTPGETEDGKQIITIKRGTKIVQVEIGGKETRVTYNGHDLAMYDRDLGRHIREII